MAFADFSADQKQQHRLPGKGADDEQGAGHIHASAMGYRVRLALIVTASLMAWGAIFEVARLIFA